MNEATTYVTPWSDEGILLILLLSRIEYCVWWNVHRYKFIENESFSDDYLRHIRFHIHSILNKYYCHITV